MKSDGYWERRQAQNMYEYMEGAEKTAQEIAQLYLKASRYISAQADGIFEKYMTKYGLTENEARRLLSELRDKASLDELLEKLRNGSNNESREELRKQLEAPAYQARLEHLRQLQNQIDMVMTQVYHLELQKNTSYYVDLGNEAYYKSMFNVQQQAGTAFSFSCIDAETIDRVMKSRWSGENYSERIWKNTRTLANNLKEELLLGVVTGKTYREMANEIQNKYAAGAYNARRLVRTEGNFVATEINFKAYEEAGIEKYRFCAILDLRTSEICRELDGKVYLVKERKVGANCPPMHPFCRSTTVAEFSEELTKDSTQRARDPATGKSITIPASMTYKEWYDKYVKGRPEAELAEKQLKNRSADRTQWKKYRAILGEDVPKRLDEFQKMKYNEPEKWRFVKLDYQRQNELLKHPELKLPNAENATASDAKFEKYLFGGTHSEGLAKGNAFSSRLGYNSENWGELRKEILSSASKYPARFLDNNGYGDRYEQKLILYGQKGTPANVIAGWLYKPNGSVSLSSVYIKEVR